MAFRIRAHVLRCTFTYLSIYEECEQADNNKTSRTPLHYISCKEFKSASECVKTTSTCEMRMCVCFWCKGQFLSRLDRKRMHVYVMRSLITARRTFSFVCSVSFAPLYCIRVWSHEPRLSHEGWCPQHAINTNVVPQRTLLNITSEFPRP